MVYKNKNKRFLKDYAYRKYRIEHFAKKYGWKFLTEEKGMIFGNKEVLLRIDAVNLTIETELVHPHKGETKLIRKGEFTMLLVEKIFRNPRVHMPEDIQSTYLKKGRGEETSPHQCEHSL